MFFTSILFILRKILIFLHKKLEIFNIFIFDQKNVNFTMYYLMLVSQCLKITHKLKFLFKERKNFLKSSF